jgi:DNA-binding LacI/PurR family transcriptional regulator
MKTKANSTDVARRAAVSRTTVSLVVNEVPNTRINEKTRQRVLKAARELNYKPNAAGRSLVRGRTATIGLVLRDLQLMETDLFLQPLLDGILQTTQRGGYGLLVESANGREGGDPFGALMDSGRIDGMIVENPDFGDKSLARLIQAGRPVVILGSQGAPEEFSVSMDDRLAGRLATQHLIDIGRRRIAHVAYSSPGIHANDRRFEGYVEALAEAGLALQPDLVTHANFSSETAYDAMAKLLRHPDGAPDAVFAGSDAVAFGVMAAIQDAGLRVPADMAVVGVDDIGTARYIRPSLSTVKSHPFQSGQAAVTMLIDLMSGKVPDQQRRMMEVALVVRGSTVEDYDRNAFAARFPAAASSLPDVRGPS